MYDIVSLNSALTPSLVTCVRVAASGGQQPVSYPFPTWQTADGAWISVDFDPAATSDQQQTALNIVAAFVQPANVLSANGKQLRYALNSLGVRSAWDQAVAASSMETQDYWFCTPGIYVPQTNSKMAKLCKAAGITTTQLFQAAITF